MIIYKSIEIKWMITGYSNYGFGTDKSLYNLKTGRKLNQSYNNGFGVYTKKQFTKMKHIKTQQQLNEASENLNISDVSESKRLPKDLYHKLKNISGSIIDYISGAKSEGVDFGDVNELILSYWDESVDFNDENIMLVKEFIGDVDKIKAYW